MSQLGADLHSHIEEENGVKKLEIEKLLFHLIRVFLFSGS